MASSFDAYRRQLLNHPELGFSLDLSRAPAPTGFAERLAPALRQALADMAALEALPGLGHKTASVVMAQAFGEPAFPVDTHIHRLAQRGLDPGPTRGSARLAALLQPPAAQ